MNFIVTQIGLALVGDVYCILVTFPCGILGQVWYLIVLFPDFCHLSYLLLRCEADDPFIMVVNV